MLTVEEAAPVFREIWERLSVSEQLRLLELCAWPKREEYRKSKLKLEAGGGGGPAGDDRRVNVVAVGKRS